MVQARAKRQSVAKDEPEFYASELTAVINDIKYRWVGGYGAVLVSMESGLRAGDVRMIGNVLFYVYSVHPRHRLWSKPKVMWTTAGLSPEYLRKLKQSIFLG